MTENLTKTFNTVFLVILLFSQPVSAFQQTTAPQSPIPVAGSPGSVPATSPAQPTGPLTISPKIGQKGKTYTIAIKSTDCAKIKFDRDEYQLLKEPNSGVTITGDDPTADAGCTYIAQLAVDEKAPFGDVILKLKPKNGPVITIPFSVIEIPPGPIPPGIEPEVDIMWTVVPQGVVKDNFGRRVGNNFYCIEIVIGNSTGYDLQIASVGFLLGPIGKAATVVANTRKEVTQKIRENQKTAIESIMQEAINAQERIRNNVNKTGAASDPEAIARETTEEIKKITDRAVAAQAAAVEAANAQAAVMTELSQQAYAQKIPVSSYRMARGSLEHGQFWDGRNLTLNTLKALGPVLTGFLPYFHNTNRRANFSEGINILSNPIEKGFELVVPDETVRQLQRMDEQILRDGVIIPNNQQLRTRAFIPKELLKLDGSIKNDPVVVTQSLGTLYLIGDKIQYINRVRVTSSAESGEVKPPPTVTPTGIRVFLRDDTKPLTLTGTGLDDATLIADDPQNIIITERSNTSTSFGADVRVTDKASLGPHTLTLSTATGAVNFTISVDQKAPVLTPAALAFKDNKRPVVNPAKDEEYEITVTGQYLQGATLSLADNAKGKLEILTPQPQVDADGKSLTVRIRVLKVATEGSYDIEVRNLSRQEYKPPPISVTVGAQPPPEFSALTFGEDESGAPPSSNPTKPRTVTINVKGKNLNGATLIPPAGFTVSKLRNESPDKLTADITIKEGTPPKEDYEFKIKNANTATVSFKFPLKAQPAPSITQTSVTAKAGEPRTVTLPGSNLEGAKIITGSVPTGWEVKIKDPSDGAQVTLEIRVPAGTAPGTKKIKIGNAGPSEAELTVEVTAP